MSVAAAIPSRTQAHRRWHPYPAYRPASVPWIGSVPQHWLAKRLKYAVRLVNEKTEDADGLPYVGLEHIESWTGGLIEPETPAQPDGVCNIFAPDDILFGKLRPYLAKVLHAQQPGVCTAEALVLRPKLVEPRFLSYYLLNRDLISVVDGSTYGSKMPRANWEFIGNLLALIPPLVEQRAIAAFLDRETAKIAALVGKKMRLIELLQEKRAALISHAVTKSLTPNAPMKDSEVEWFGSLPVHWNIKRLKYIVPGITVGIVVTPAKYYVDEGVPCLRSLNISSSRIITDDIVYISPESNELHCKSKIHAGDIVIVRTGQTGTAAVVSETLEGANCIDLVIVRRSKRVLSDYLHYFINSRAAAHQVEAKTVGSIQGHYNTSTVGDLLVPLPPLLEQEQIVNELNNQCGYLDRLASAATDGLDRLREYRSALISSAVTGKIDVRNHIHEEAPCP